MPHRRAGWLLFAVTLLAGCQEQGKPAPPAAAPEKPKVESELAYVTISAKARVSLGIESQPIRTGPVQEHIALTGWVMARQGNEVTITAPVAGYVRLVKGQKSFPAIGETVADQQVLLALEPVLSPVEQIHMAALKRGVDSELTKARNSLSVAKSELERVEELHKQGLRGKQEVEQAQLKGQHALEDVKAAEDKLKLFDRTLEPQVLTAPRGGKLSAVYVSPGQYVAAAAPLLTVVDLSEVWLRVPVPEFDLPLVNWKQEASVRLKGDNGAGRPLRATPLGKTPQVDTARHTADLFYDLGIAKLSPRLDFAKDQMLTVYVPLDQKRTESVVPYGAVVFDAFGGSWIYLDRTADKGQPKYQRRRVKLGPLVEGGVVIWPTAATGDLVVTAHAADLFSREFHSPPVAGKQVVDDDD